MRQPEDLSLGYGLAHVLGCELDESSCPVCQSLQKPSNWPPARMIESSRLSGVYPGFEFSENFHVKRVEWESDEAQRTAVKKAQVREMLSDPRA